MSGLIRYATDDGRIKIKLRATDQTVSPTQREMAQLLDVSSDNVGLQQLGHIAERHCRRAAATV